MFLKYGKTDIEFEINGCKSIKYLNETQIEEIKDIKLEFLNSMKNCINSPELNNILTKDDKVTIVVSDITRFWMRQDIIVPLLVDYLCDIGIPYENIVIVIGVGTHRFQTEDELKTLVTNDIYTKVKVINHDCDADDLIYLGDTSRKTPIWVNPFAVNRKVITIGGVVHHLMAGFGGGRKSILPGISGRKTISKNHIHALSPDMPKSNPLIGTGALENNPLNEDMIEGALMVNPCFGINIIVNTKSKHCKIICGNFIDSWKESCEIVQEYFGVPIEKKADIAIVSCGGYPKDISLYQATKTIFNANLCVKENGTIIFLAKCPEGGGADEFFGWKKSLVKGTLVEDLRKDFTISGYIFFALCEVCQSKNVIMLTDIDKETLADMNIKGYTDMNLLLNDVDFNNKDVYIMPYGGNTVPFIKE